MAKITKAQAAKVFGAALFSHARRLATFTNMMTGAAPKAIPGVKNHGKTQTEEGAPIVEINDLTKASGDTIEMDLIHDLTGLPTMGDEHIEGNGEDMSKTIFELSINQGRKAVNSGGKMAQQRTPQNLLSAARKLLGRYYAHLKDEIAMYQLAGARGDLQATDIIMPLEVHNKFSKIMVNGVLPPTYERHFFAGDATTIEGLDSMDKMSIDTIENISLYLEEMPNPIKSVSYGNDTQADASPYFVLWVTPRQYQDAWDSATEKKILELMANATKRGKGFNHPIFQGDMIMWKNILVRKYKKPVRFYAGSTVTVSNNDDTATTKQVTVSVDVDRAILLGGQAMAMARGKSGAGGQFTLTGKKMDHGNATEHVISWMDGCKKVRFEDLEGKTNDFGVMVIDSAVNLAA